MSTHSDPETSLHLENWCCQSLLEHFKKYTVCVCVKLTFYYSKI